MKSISISLAALFFASSVAAQEATPDVAVEAIGGHKVRLRGFDLERRADGRVYVHGWARRESGRAGLINAHLHVETFDANGASLGVTEGGWNAPLSMRDRASSPVHVELAPDPSISIARVRVSVEQGARHD